MGSQSSHAQLTQAVQRAESRRGRIQVEGRYHHMTKHVEDDYDMEDSVLGSGANGDVMLATNKYTGTKVAVKTLKLHGLSDTKKLELVNEVEVYLCMDHPHIARLFEVYESEDTLSLVMEFMEGGELFDRVSSTSKKRLTESDVASATWQMLLAVNYLHSEGVVHRDLKLENFLFEKKRGNYLKLIDFGFSKICGKGKHLESSCGTLSYVAPEVLDKPYTSQCDLWSLGVIVFVLLCGKLPFYGKDDMQTLQAIRKGQYNMTTKHWSHVSEQAKDFVKHLLIVTPSRRMTAEQALQHPWIMRRPQTHTDAVDSRVAESLIQFAKQPRFRRACNQLMAWSLSIEERSQVRDAFLELDRHHTGLIKLSELKQTLEERFNVPVDVSCSVVDAFKELDGEHGEVIHYSDFLAAMLSSRLALHDDLLKETFRHFDTRDCGYISPSALKCVLGRSFDADQIFEVLDTNHDGKISVDELIQYLRAECEEEVVCKTSDVSMDAKRRSVSDWSTDVSASEVGFSANDSADEEPNTISCSSGLGLRTRLRRLGSGVMQGGCLGVSRVRSPSSRGAPSGGA